MYTVNQERQQNIFVPPCSLELKHATSSRFCNITQRDRQFGCTNDSKRGSVRSTVSSSDDRQIRVLDVRTISFSIYSADRTVWGLFSGSSQRFRSTANGNELLACILSECTWTLLALSTKLSCLSISAALLMLREEELCRGWSCQIRLVVSVGCVRFALCYIYKWHHNMITALI